MSHPYSIRQIPAIIFALYILCNGFATTHAVKPYTPVHPDPTLEPWRWRSFPELKGKGVMCIAQDNSGNMWFGTGDGVCLYDGVNWTFHGAPEGLDGLPVTSLSVSEAGNIYAATERAVYVYQVPTWQRIFPPQDDLPWYISDLVVGADEDIWIGTTWGLISIQDQETKLYTLKEIKRNFEQRYPEIQYTVVPDDAAFAYSTPYSSLGLQRIGATISWVIKDSPADSAGLQIGDQIVDIQALSIQDENEHTQLTIRRNGQTTQTVTLYNRPGEGTLKEFGIHNIFRTRNNTLWFSLPSGQIVRLDRTTEQWHIFSDKEGMEFGERPYLAEMDNGDIWVITDERTHGIYLFNGQAWSSFKLSESGGIDINPSILQTTDGTIWVGASEGILHAQRDGAWVTYQIPEVPLPETRIVDLLESKDGALWIIGQQSEPIRLDFGNNQWTTFEGLNYECQGIDSHLWFLSSNGEVIRFDGHNWSAYDTSDGLIDAPTGIYAAQNGDLWVVGSHKEIAASAQLKNGTWWLQTYPKLSWGIDSRAIFETRDGAIWLGAAVDWSPDHGYRGGVLRITSENQTHYPSPDVLRYIYGIGQMADSSVWMGSQRGLHVFAQNTWTRVDSSAFQSNIDVVYTPPSGELWLGHRHQGIFQYNGHTWQHYDTEHGLAGNTIRSILKTQDNSVWAISTRGINRFDGTQWTTTALPPELYTDLRGLLKQSTDGALWINTAPDAWHRRAWPERPPAKTDPQDVRVVRYVPDTKAPETTISLALKEVSQPGNTTITWQGTDPWHQTPTSNLLYSWQLDHNAWTSFAEETHHVFQALKSGDHVFRVRARDRDLNADLTPAEFSFTVIPPIWQQPWFLTLATISLALIVLQTTRVIRRDRRLQKANQALSDANHQLFDLNQQLRAANQHLEETREQLLIQEKMVSLGNLVAGVAHEMNTPLGVLKSSADIMRRCLQRIAQLNPQITSTNEANYQKSMTLLEDNAKTTATVSERLSQIVNSLRNFARLDESEFQHVNIHEGLESILLLRNNDLQNKIQIIKTFGNLPPVACYPGELNQVFMNVLSNAIDAIHKTGTIHIETRTVDTDAQIVFFDTGRGIPPENLNRIFNPGFTTKGVGIGVGLGLSLCYRIIQKHRGTITVTSEEGQGTTCTITIPIKAKRENR